jgi:hypothetical protein
MSLSTLNVPFDISDLSNTPRRLWVDAICINQTNDAEKGNHVCYMSEVYRRCTTDLLWMGECNGIIDNAVVSMEYFGNLLGLDQKLRHFSQNLTTK